MAASDKGGAMDSVTVTIANISRDRDQAYEACPTCRKKVIAGMNGMTCEKCQKDVETPEWRYVIQVQVADHTASHWISLFNDEGCQLMGMTADELMAIKQSDADQYGEQLVSPVWKQVSHTRPAVPCHVPPASNTITLTLTPPRTLPLSLPLVQHGAQVQDGHPPGRDSSQEQCRED